MPAGSGPTNLPALTEIHFVRPDHAQITLTSKVDLIAAVLSGDIRLSTPLRVGVSGTWAQARDLDEFRGLAARGERVAMRYLAYLALNAVLFCSLVVLTVAGESGRPGGLAAHPLQVLIFCFALASWFEAPLTTAFLGIEFSYAKTTLIYFGLLTLSFLVYWGWDALCEFARLMITPDDDPREGWWPWVRAIGLVLGNIIPKSAADRWSVVRAANCGVTPPYIDANARVAKIMAKHSRLLAHAPPWFASESSGKRLQILPNGDRYEGDVDKGGRGGTGTRQGYGVYIWADGQRYEGKWKKNLRDGPGVAIGRDGLERAETWEAGERVNPPT